MKSLALIAAVALSAAFIPFKAPAKDMILNVSGTIKSRGEDTGLKGTITSKSVNEKTIYTLITNALASGTYIPATNIPAGGYIAFNPYITNADGSYGTFYITNKTSFYYALSGLDATNAYYSFIELDTYVYVGAGFGLDSGYDYVFSDLTSYSLTSGTGTSTGVFYVHDNPYAYDDADYPDTLVQNTNAIEIRGIVTAPFKLIGGTPTISSFSLTGTGNSVLGGNLFSSLVSSGHASLAQ